MKERIPPSWEGRVEISSAGVCATNGIKAAGNAVKVMGELGIDISGHLSAQLSESIVEQADLLVTMSSHQADLVNALIPGSSGRTLILGSLDTERTEIDIADPIGGDIGVYASARDEIGSLLELLIEFAGKRFGLDEVDNR